MMSMADFRQRQEDLRRRADRQLARSRIRARLEQQLRDLVAEELRRETDLGAAVQPSLVLEGESDKQDRGPRYWWTER